jgi:hypothetical protein
MDSAHARGRLLEVDPLIFALILFSVLFCFPKRTENKIKAKINRPTIYFYFLAEYARRLWAWHPLGHQQLDVGSSFAS